MGAHFLGNDLHYCVFTSLACPCVSSFAKVVGLSLILDTMCSKTLEVELRRNRGRGQG